MDVLIINGTEDTPAITMDPVNGKYEFSGRSLPEDVTAFYKPVIEWLAKFADASFTKACFEFKLEYFNTASSKIILDILMTLQDIKELNKDVSVKWYYDPNDDDMLEAGEEYKELVEEVEFEILPL